MKISVRKERIGEDVGNMEDTGSSSEVEKKRKRKVEDCKNKAKRK
jgi:hypothetical protein